MSDHCRQGIFGMGLLLFVPLCFAAPKIATIHPHRGVIQRSFTELARTKLENTYEINMPLSGEVDRIVLKPGNRVMQNQLVAQLVQLPLQQDVQKARAQLETFNAYLAYQLRDYHRKAALAKKHFISKADLDNTRSKVRMLAAQLKDAKAALAIAQYHLQQSKLYSPINGVVLKRYTQGQKWLVMGSPLLDIGNLSELEVISEVLSQDAQLLRPGDPVVLTNPGAIVLNGKVKRIDPAGFTKKSSLGVDEQRVDVTIAFNQLEKVRLGVGYRLQAKFLVGKANKSALIVPRFSVLQNNQGQFYVFKINHHKLKKQVVQIGIATDKDISIASGLAQQDSIVAQPTADMRDGMKV